MKKLSHKVLRKSVRIALASVLSIAIAGELGLDYPATAGIITILSIQNTRRETFKSARNRALAFLCALMLSFLSFYALGFTLWAFAIYLLLFALLCQTAGWTEALATDSVLVTHFLTAGSMTLPQIANETALLLIGVGVGIVANLFLQRRAQEFSRLAADADEKMRAILCSLSQLMISPDKDKSLSDKSSFDKSSFDKTCFDALEESLSRARLCAVENYNNTLWQQDTCELDYIRMRGQQSLILQGICEVILRIDSYPAQTRKVAALLEHTSAEYHRDNTVEELQKELAELLAEMKQEALPVTREEFEARALLFYILSQMEQFLLLKNQFMKNVSTTQAASNRRSEQRESEKWYYVGAGEEKSDTGKASGGEAGCGR